MDKISQERQLEWLTTTVPTRKRAMIYSDSLQVPRYKITRLQRQIHQPSFGTLGKLPSELSSMVFQHLTCDDLEVLHSGSTGGRIAALAFPQYYNLLKHAPTLLAILKQTGLARSFTIAQIYETFTSSLCTTCGQFGAYVFLPSFTRCCLHCAETKLKFLPIFYDGAKLEFGVNGKRILDSVPELKSIEGYYSTFRGEIRYYTHHLTLFSRELVEKLRDPNHPLSSVQRLRENFCENSVKAHHRYMALTALPCFIPKSASVERGVYCIGCDTRAKEHGLCDGTDEGDHDSEYKPILVHVTEGLHASCGPKGIREQCHLVTEQDRLHDSRYILNHLQSCTAAQAVLKMKWTQSQEKKSAR